MSNLIEVKVPSTGESISSVIIASLAKSVGDAVRKGEVLFELESDKASLEVNSPVEGIIKSVTANVEDEVAVGTILFTIEEQAVAAAPVSEQSPAQNVTESSAAAQSGPAARMEAHKRNINIDDVSGSGVRGRVLSKDVRAAAQPEVKTTAPPPAPAVQDTGALTERVRMTRIRRVIAKNLVQSQQNSAMLTTFNEADLSHIKALRKKYQERFVKKHGIKLGFMSFFVKAAIEALREYPAVNAEIDEDYIVYKRFYNIGVAVSTERGLMVPVIRNAEQLSFAEVEQEIYRLAVNARDGKLRPADFNNGTFTISNGGIFGSLMSTPILNPPQVGILGMHSIVDRPVNVNGEVVIRPMMYLALSYDHRIIDGRQAVGFLKKIKELVENPERILLDV